MREDDPRLVFANATPERPALYFTILGEPTIKMLRYQQQYTFFDQTKLNNCIRFINLGETVLQGDLDAVLDAIRREVEAVNPGVVVVDSFRTAARGISGRTDESEQQSFIQRLALHLTSWEATTFLIGEYIEREMQGNPVFTVADGLFWLHQSTEQNSIVRKLQIMKLRGQGNVPGLHTFRIDENGLKAFSRTLGMGAGEKKPQSSHRLSLGVPELDKMMNGGPFEGDSILVAGPSGSGKTALASHFIDEGIRKGEPAVIAVSEERPRQFATRASALGLDLTTPQEKGMLEILYLRPLDLSVDETLYELLQAVERIGARRMVIDSLAGFEMALAPGFRTDFRESLYRLISTLTGAGITVLSTVEVEESFVKFSFSHYLVSFLTDDIIRLRYVEIDGQLRKVVVVVKMRGGNHAKDIREYIITDKGLVLIGERLRDFRALITGIPERTVRGSAPPEPTIDE